MTDVTKFYYYVEFISLKKNEVIFSIPNGLVPRVGEYVFSPHKDEDDNMYRVVSICYDYFLQKNSFYTISVNLKEVKRR